MNTEPIDTLARIQEASFARASEATRGAFPEERRMDGAMLLSFLTGKRYAVLATTRPDGRPQAAPVGYALVGTKFVMGSLPDAQRVRNLRHEPHASVVIEQGEGDQHAVVIVDGTTRLLEPLEASLDMRAPFRDDAGALPEWIGILVVLTPERLLSYAASGFQV
ncbi:MAG TPA: pyridoxamine 5'-phosphate oxidase family protein [Actinomycetota bacterium]|nr:pyridoxamine 5'-phosphate oxidase family protein [Actinomycetota bacterium]